VQKQTTGVSADNPAWIIIFYFIFFHFWEGSGFQGVATPRGILYRGVTIFFCGYIFRDKVIVGRALLPLSFTFCFVRPIVAHVNKGVRYGEFTK
jgi:hypothetical protein